MITQAYQCSHDGKLLLMSLSLLRKHVHLPCLQFFDKSHVRADAGPLAPDEIQGRCRRHPQLPHEVSGHYCRRARDPSSTVHKNTAASTSSSINKDRNRLKVGCKLLCSAVVVINAGIVVVLDEWWQLA